MMRLPCAYLHGDVELNDKRELHIAEVGVSAAQSCFRDGILISKAANTSSSWS